MRRFRKNNIQSIFLLIILIFSINEIKAQKDSTKANLPAQFDSIKFVNGSKQAAKIIEISSKYVKYKNPYNPEGPTFIVKRKDIEGFVLKGGCLDLKEQGFENCIKDPTFDFVQEKNFKHRVISFDLAQLCILHFQLNIDFIFRNKKNGIGIFGNLGYSDPYAIYTYDRKETSLLFAGGFYKKSYLGIDYKIFPSAHKKITYFCSLGVDFGKSYFKESKLILGSYYTPIVPRHTEVYMSESIYLGYRFNNGFVWRITKHLLCQATFTLGVNHFNYYDDEVNKRVNSFLPKLSSGVLIGYAF